MEITERANELRKAADEMQKTQEITADQAALLFNAIADILERIPT